MEHLDKMTKHQNSKQQGGNNHKEKIYELKTEISVLREVQHQSEKRLIELSNQIEKVVVEINNLKEEMAKISTLIQLMNEQFLRTTSEKLKNNENKINTLEKEVTELRSRENYKKWIWATILSILSLLISGGILVSKIIALTK